MEKRFLYGLVVILMYLVDSGYSQGEVVKSEEADEFVRFLNEAQQPVVLTLTSSLCGVPCAILVEQVAQLAKTYGNRVIFYNANILEKPFFSRLYNVLSVPTLIAFKGGKEIKRLETNFYWGAVYDQIFKDNFLSLYSAPVPAPAPAPFHSAPLGSPLLEALENATSSSTWEYAVAESPLPIVLTITSTLCGVPCVILEDQVARLAETYGKQIIFYAADILEKPFFAQLYKVVSFPTVVVLKDGKEIFRFEKLSDWGNISDILFQSRIFDSFSPSPSPLGE